MIFAIRAGAVSFPLLTLVLWRGIGAGALARVAAVLLAVVVPVIYLITSPANQGGYDFSYPVKLIWAHWVGVGALVLLGLSLFMTLAAARSERRRASQADGASDSIQAKNTPRAAYSKKS